MGLRIIERVREEYGGGDDAHIAEEMNPFTNPSKAKKVKKALQAKIETGSTPDQDLSSHATSKEAPGGGLFADDDDDDDDVLAKGGGFFLDGHDEMEVPHRAGELTVDDLSNSSSLVRSEVVNDEPPDIGESDRSVIKPDFGDKVLVTVPRDSSINKKKVATTMSTLEGRIPGKAPNRRAAPKRKAATKSETALKSQSLGNESAEDDDSDREKSMGKRSAVKKPTNQKIVKDGSGRSLRSRKRTCYEQSNGMPGIDQ